MLKSVIFVFIFFAGLVGAVATEKSSDRKPASQGAYFCDDGAPQNKGVKGAAEQAEAWCDKSKPIQMFYDGKKYIYCCISKGQ